MSFGESKRGREVGRSMNQPGDSMCNHGVGLDRPCTSCDTERLGESERGRSGVRNGVCLLCGSAVLTSGRHLRADLPPCYGSLTGGNMRAGGDPYGG